MYLNGVVVQLVRMPACHAGGREFESRPYRQSHPEEGLKGFLFLFPIRVSLVRAGFLFVRELSVFAAVACVRLHLLPHETLL